MHDYPLSSKYLMNHMLENKVILITGASRGIGRAVAKALAKHGATMILLSRTLKDLEDLHDEIVDTTATHPSICAFNLCTAQATDYDDLRRNILNQYGRLDGLIHNAGMLGALTPLEHYNLQTWYQVLQVNLNSTFLLTQACLSALKNSPSGSIVFTDSSASDNPKANWGAYAVASAGRTTMMRMLASECETITNIRVNAVRPYQVRTAWYKEAYPAQDSNILMSPEDLAPKYVYLMSDASKHLNGQIITHTQELAQV